MPQKSPLGACLARIIENNSKCICCVPQPERFVFFAGLEESGKTYTMLKFVYPNRNPDDEKINATDGFLCETRILDFWYRVQCWEAGGKDSVR